MKIEIDMKSLRIPLFFISLYSILSILLALYGFHGGMSIFSLVEFILFLCLFANGAVFAIKGLFKKGILTKLIHVVIGILIFELPVIVMDPASEYGIKRKFYTHNKQLVSLCDRLIKELPANEPHDMSEFKELNIWPQLMKPDGYVVHNDGVIYIVLERSPDGSHDVVYNPTNKTLSEIFHIPNRNLHERGIHCDKMFGPWLRCNFDYE